MGAGTLGGDRSRATRAPIRRTDVVQSSGSHATHGLVALASVSVRAGQSRQAVCKSGETVQLHAGGSAGAPRTTGRHRAGRSVSARGTLRNGWPEVGTDA